MFFQQTTQTPMGKLTVRADDVGVTQVLFDATETECQMEQGNDITALASTQLNEYFSGTRTHFNVPLNAQGTDFQKTVWQALCEIEYGNTCSYGDIAHRIGNPKSVRAVGMANGRNPIAIIVPCHRVIGKNGTLTGYAGGLARKASLLTLEGATFK